MSDLNKKQIQKLILEGWKCDDFKGLCTVASHKGQAHQLITHSKLRPEDLASRGKYLTFGVRNVISRIVNLIKLCNHSDKPFIRNKPKAWLLLEQRVWRREWDLNPCGPEGPQALKACALSTPPSRHERASSLMPFSLKMLTLGVDYGCQGFSCSISAPFFSFDFSSIRFLAVS
jgi:hypothetical protein